MVIPAVCILSSDFPPLHRSGKHGPKHCAVDTFALGEIMKGMGISIKRIYDEPVPEDGYRILVDRLWPRGMRKERAALDMWMKDIAPSSELRRWFGHDPERFDDFAQRYRSELDVNKTAVEELARLLLEHRTITLLYAAKSPICNHAVVLRDYMREYAIRRD